MKFKKLISSFFILSIVFSPFFSNKASAQWAVFDVPNTAVGGVNAINTTSLSVKEWFADMITKLAVNFVVTKMTVATVNWINSGFQGKPAYVTNPDQFFGNIAKGVAGQYIYNNPNFRFMCTGFNIQVRAAITRAYQQPLGTFQCSLDTVISNFDNFIGDFDQGGWQGFLSVSQNSQNNPIGLYTSWQDEYTRIAQNEIQKKQDQLNQGNGFLSFEKCTTEDTDVDYTEYYACLQDPEHAGDVQYCELNFPPVSKGPGPKTCKTETPGNVISNKLNATLGLSDQTIVTADEVNELISALINQLTNKLLTAGLGALSRKGSGGNADTSYTGDLDKDALRLDQSIKDQEKNTADQTDRILQTINGAIINSTTGTTGGTADNLLYVCNLPGGGQGVKVGTNGVCQAGGTGSGFIPITASDGSIITGMPLDPQCAAISFDEIVNRATAMHASNPGLGTIASIVQNMQCTGGVLP